MRMQNIVEAVGAVWNRERIGPVSEAVRNRHEFVWMMPLHASFCGRTRKGYVD